jgi:hypothetical protein
VDLYLLANDGNTELDLTSRTGNFNNGETITGATSGATGTLVFDSADAGVTQIYITGVSGSFVNGETITGQSSGQTAAVTGSSIIAGDLFAWFENSGSGPVGSIALANITGNPQVLGSTGITVTFGATTGHSTNTQWTITQGSSFFGEIDTHIFKGDRFILTDRGSHTLKLKSPALSSNLTFTLPNSYGTNGQVLKTDGSGILSWANGSGAGVSGSNGQIQFNNNGSFGASNNLFWDNQSGRLGIGTNNPTSLLTVVGTGSIHDLFMTMGTNGQNILGASYDGHISLDNIAYVFPGNQASSGGQILTNDGNGNLTWATPSGGGSSQLYVENYSSSSGFFPLATGVDSVAIGGSNFASNRPLASGDYSVAIGGSTTSSGLDGPKAIGVASVAIGTTSKAYGAGSIALGWTSQANGDFSFASGFQSVANGARSFALGSRALATTDNEIALGSNSANQNAITILGNGNIGFGTNTPGAALDIQLADSYHTYKQTIGSQRVSASLIATFSGTYTGMLPNDVFTLTADSTGTPTTFSWSATSGSSGSGVTITPGTPQLLEDGIYITFDTNSSGSTYGSAPTTTYTISSSPSMQITDKNGNPYFVVNSVIAGSTFIGDGAGLGASAASSSIFMGDDAGYNAVSASGSVFLGGFSGYASDHAHSSQFIGSNSGSSAANAYGSSFIGTEAGENAPNAANSIFIGYRAGQDETVLDNTASYDESSTFADTSILIGHGASTGGHSDSIAIGAYAKNTASNQLMIGSSNASNTRINSLVFNDGTGNTCVLATSSGLSCSSDIRLKTNIVDLPTTTLDTLTKVRTVTYHWIDASVDTNEHIGFLAQDLQTFYPDLVSQNADGMLSVNYANMAPVLVEAIRELNVKVTSMADLTTADNSFVQQLVAWLGNSANGITNIFSKQVTTDKLCVGTVCVTQDQFMHMVQNGGQGGGGTTVAPQQGTTTGSVVTSGDATTTTGDVGTTGGTTGDVGTSGATTSTGTSSTSTDGSTGTTTDASSTTGTSTAEGGSGTTTTGDATTGTTTIDTTVN